MLRFAPLAVLAFSTLAQAQSDRLGARHYAQECCPCPAPGAQQDNIKTVTVTEPAGAGPTVTVTLPNEAASQETVYITHTEHKTVIQEVTVVPVPSYPVPNNEAGNTMTVTAGQPAPTQALPNGNGKDVYTNTPEAGNNQSQNSIVTVTVSDNNNNSNNNDYQVKTVTSHNPTGPSYVKTITLDHNIDEAKTAPAGYPQLSNTIKTVTVSNSQDRTRVIVTATPCTTTLTLDNGNETTVVYHEQHTLTVTSPPQTPCPAVPISTSTSTVYNTVVVTVGPDAAGSGQEDSSSSSRDVYARRPRAPLSARRW
ncbi:hypothetical protein BGZ63DRAFT_390896 [Mariannaea sp. PMI_226]|nr:hypothetical protein BGZ63DRAFT_390896 [Mariannaea sp. PMI_226]